MEDLTGKQFGPYQIVEPLGEGGMAAVYKAFQPSMERFVAVKVLPRHMATSEEFVNRFRREAKLLAQLQHPHILPVFDYGEAEGYPYIVMPFVPTGTLSELIQKRHLRLPEVRRIMIQVSDALAYAHARGMIHRDIKPSNVLIDERGNCLLTDFGLARMTESATKITTSGTVMGTPAYMSPEQGAGNEIDQRSDIYSLGVILYEMITGRVPYTAETPIAIVFKHIQDPLPSARKLNPTLPESVELVLLKALAKTPEDRYQTADAFTQAIQKAISETETPSDEKTLIAEAAPSAEPKATERIAQAKAESEPHVRSPAAEQKSPRSRWLTFGLVGGLILLLVCGFGALRLRASMRANTVRNNPTPTHAQALQIPPDTPTRTVPTPPAQVHSAPPGEFKVAQVTDLGGIDDKSFNASAFQGIERAMQEFGVQGKFLESQQQSDYSRNIQQLLDEDTDLIITVGFLLGVDTANAARAHPDRKFAIVDYAYPDCWEGAEEGKNCGSFTEIPNVIGLTFRTEEAAFLAGYAAAANTRTGKVATYGGLNIPTVTNFMRGFEAGLRYYNRMNNARVELLGWSTEANDGSFAGNFESLDDGRAFAESFAQEGADIILPVAGPMGLGSAVYCQETRTCLVIGVDTDWTVSASEYREVVFTSILKNMNVAVFNVIKATLEGNFRGGVFVGTLENNGVGIAPIKGATPDLMAMLDKIRADIINGNIRESP